MVGGGGAAAERAEAVERAACIICCEPLLAVAVGACGHTEVCAACSLRSRTLYRDLKCPLCKTEQVRPSRSPIG